MSCKPGCCSSAGQPLPYLLQGSISGHRFRIAWISCRIRHPKDRNQTAHLPASQFLLFSKTSQSPAALSATLCPLQEPHQSSLSLHGSCNATCGNWAASPSAQTRCRAPAPGSGCYQAAPRSRSVPIALLAGSTRKPWQDALLWLYSEAAMGHGDVGSQVVLPCCGSAESDQSLEEIRVQREPK